jgi:hypothetical protein
VPIELAALAATRWVALEAAVDGTATFTIVPAPLLARIGLTPTGRVPVPDGAGAVREYDTGEVQFRMGGRHGYTRVVFAEPDATALLGQLVLNTLLLAVDASDEQLVPIEEGWR